MTSYLLISAAAIVHVFVPLAAPDRQVPSVLAAALAWSAGFALCAVRYWLVTTRPRLDVQPG